MNIRFVLSFCAATLLVASGSVMAHNPLAHPDWCEGDSRLVIVDDLDWSESDLRARAEQCPGDSGGGRTCGGQFDDDWARASKQAGAHCQQYEVRFADSTDPDHGSVVFIASGPAEYVHRDHHRLFEKSLGLSGSCVRCEPLPEVIPPRR